MGQKETKVPRYLSKEQIKNILIEEDIVAAMKNKSSVGEVVFEGRKSKWFMKV